MKKSVLCFLVALAALVVVDAVLSIVSTGLATQPSANHPSYTISDSKARGAFIEEVTFTPSTVDWKGEQIRHCSKENGFFLTHRR